MLRAAASSIARGSPSSCRQSAATVAAEFSRQGKRGADGAGALDKEADGGVLGQTPPGSASRLSGSGSGFDREKLFAVQAQRRAAGGQHLQRGTGVSSPPSNAAASPSTCSQLSSSSSVCRGTQGARQIRRAADGQGSARRRGRWQSSPPPDPGRSAVPDRPRRRRRAKASADVASDASARRVLPTPPGPVKVSSGTASSSRKSRARPRSRLPADEPGARNRRRAEESRLRRFGHRRTPLPC